jgi:hypothetical protein
MGKWQDGEMVFFANLQHLLKDYFTDRFYISSLFFIFSLMAV